MSRKQRKSKAKRREQAIRSSLVLKGTNQGLKLPVPLSVEPELVKSTGTRKDYIERYRYVFLELKRSIIIAAALFFILIVLKFFL
jgi:hypothetical protein